MRFETEDGQSLELRILGYQFPDLETEDYDSNWLNIEGKVAHVRGSWQFCDPCLLTYEASELADWLDALASDPCSGTLTFIEPNLSFRSLESPAGTRLRVYFELEARPPWAPFDVGDEGQCWIDLPVSTSELRLAGAALRDQLTVYPQRAAR